MARIGLVPGSFKPFHRGHHALIALASIENDQVTVFASASDRGCISGSGMAQVWQELIVPVLPTNVEVRIGGTPLSHVFDVIEAAERAGRVDSIAVYSDASDAVRMAKLAKYAPRLTAAKLVGVRTVDRASTVQVSGTQMREWFNAGDCAAFVEHLPLCLDGSRYWNILRENPSARLQQQQR